jgi:GNAT superfamily N-acetyltransferase
MDVSPPAARFFGLSVLAHARRQGVQQAMLAWRISEAARRECVVACIGSLPGAGTERNVRRMGFAPAYTKVTLVRLGAGLAPVAG